MSDDEPLIQLLVQLQRLDYRFVAVSPATHARVLARPWCGAATLRDIFGWSRPFVEPDLAPDLLELLKAGGALQGSSAELRSGLRVASLGDKLFLHSAFPTSDTDSVFFGPDTYRFAQFIRHQLPRLESPPRWIVDMGAGSGAGGIIAADQSAASRITLVDINPAALRLARINAAAAEVNVDLVESAELPSGADLVIANPPYMIDPATRSYRHGGDLLGGGVALDWVRQALRSMAPGGTLLLYTGAAVSNGESPLIDGLNQVCTQAGARLTVEELDPDVFGEELEQKSYQTVERIAAIGAVIRKPS